MIQSKRVPIFAHVPKTGGTSLRNTLGLPEWTKLHRKIGGPEMRKAVLRAGDDAHLFMFLRDPIERALSAFYYFVWSRDQGEKTPGKFSAVKQKAWLFSVIARIADIDVNDFYRGLFREEAMQYRRLSKVIVHFMPQSKWYACACKLDAEVHTYDFGKFTTEYERLLDDLQAIKRPRLQHRMKTHRKGSISELAPDVLAMLREFYADDLALLRKLGMPVTSDNL